MAHPLKVWRVENDLNLAQAAQRFGVSAAMVSFLERYQKVPSTALAKRIENLTDGRVKRSDYRLESPVKKIKKP